MAVPRCINTGVAIPECSCRQCARALIDRYAPDLRHARPMPAGSWSGAPSGDHGQGSRARSLLAAGAAIKVPTTALAPPCGDEDAA